MERFGVNDNLYVIEYINDPIKEWIYADSPSSTSEYYIPSKYDDYSALKQWVRSLPDGRFLYVRGRDVIHTIQVNEEDEGFKSPTIAFTEWERGICIKFESAMFFLWRGKVESYSIGSIDFQQLVQFESKKVVNILPITSIKPSSMAVTNNCEIILCHGFSDISGPKYPFISILQTWLTDIGYESVNVPDFRPSYKFGPYRGRSERVRIILEEIISIMCRKPGSKIVLIGHSQGGAACAQVCASEKLVHDANIVGLVMMGSESPIERLEDPINRMLIPGEEITEDDKRTKEEKEEILINLQRPVGLRNEDILLIHSNRDRVISHLQISQLSSRWEVPIHLLETTSTAVDEVYCEWSNDVQHDFIALELLPQVFTLLSNFLNSKSTKPKTVL